MRGDIMTSSHALHVSSEITSPGTNLSALWIYIAHFLVYNIVYFNSQHCVLYHFGTVEVFICLFIEFIYVYSDSSLSPLEPAHQ